jgi:hypothetical protein
MGLSYMKCGVVDCEKARLLNADFCQEHLPAPQQASDAARELAEQLVTQALAEEENGGEWFNAQHVQHSIPIIQAAFDRVRAAAIRAGKGT